MESTFKQILGKYFRLTQYNSVFVVLIILVVSALLYRPSFFRLDNVNMILRQASALGILTMGHLFVISTGCVDLSVAAIMQMSIAVFMVSVRTMGNEWLFVGILISLAVALVIGVINGLIIARWNVQPFLATLFMGAILIGIRNLAFGTTPLGVPPAPLVAAIKGNAQTVISNCIFMFLLVALIAHIVINHTVFGRRVMMVGTNRIAATFSGIRVDRTIITAYCISAISAVFAGIVATGYLGFADQTTIGNGMEMDSMVAAVLGGNYLSGGRASVSGAIGGVLAMSLILNIVVLFGLDIRFQYVLKGLILIAVVYVSARSKSA
jgi:ribose/xylose/arabinose/galactoside ABC-type transport system permease subunit